MKGKYNWKMVERIVYILLLIGLVIFGVMKDSEGAARLIHAIYEAFTILFNT